jgi:N-acetylmuramoyl-L-alanine amidase
MIEANLGNKLYKVQVGAFSKRENAEKLLSELKSKGYSAFIKIE